MQRWNRLLAVCLVSVAVGALVRPDWAELRWKLAGPELEWPRVEGYDLHFDVSRPGRFRGRVRVELSGVERDELTLLLNEDLEVSSASALGGPVTWQHFWSLPSRYHREGRVVRFDLPRAPANGEVTLEFEYAGEAASGRTGSDWRGILFVDADEVRMCEQTIFYPQVPLSRHGPVVAKAPYRMTVVAPRAWELFVPAPGGVPEETGETDATGATGATGATDATDPTRTWSFETKDARHPALLGGLLERAEAQLDGSQVVTLLRAEHAALAPGFVEEATAAIANFTERFGAIDAGVVGIVEIHCRDSSYNWAAEGVMAFDRGALSGSVPVAKVAHEVAHLWWGQRVEAAGPGERFLTEGLAEFSAWSYLLDAGRGEEVLSNVHSARRRTRALVEAGQSLALGEVTFASPEYSTLAYGKGALVPLNLRAQLPAGAFDRGLRALVELGAERAVGLEDFLAALRRATGREALHVPWVTAAGDIALRVEEARVVDSTFTATLVAESVPAGADLLVAGTPLAFELGGRGWSERRFLALEGPRTLVGFELGERELAFALADPEGAWMSSVENGRTVLDGARLTDAEPASGSSAVFGGTRLRLTFDRPLTAPNLEQLQRSRANGSDAARFDLLAVELSEDSHELLLETRPWLPGHRYRLDLGSLRDTDGLPMLDPWFELDVAPSDDQERARIVATAPAVGARVAAPGGRLRLALTFDEPMQPGQAITGAGVREIQARGLRKPDLAGFGRWSTDCRTIEWTCENLVAGATYALPIRSRSFHDLSGNGCEELDLVFTVTATDRASR